MFSCVSCECCVLCVLCVCLCITRNNFYLRSQQCLGKSVKFKLRLSLNQIITDMLETRVGKC